jgi:hypothetical protein
MIVQYIIFNVTVEQSFISFMTVVAGLFSIAVSDEVTKRLHFFISETLLCYRIISYQPKTYRKKYLFRCTDEVKPQSLLKHHCGPIP